MIVQIPEISDFHPFTQTLDLSQNWSQLLSKWSSGHRASLNKGLKLGVTCRSATTESDWKSYYEIYMDTLQRWEKPLDVYQWRLFELLRSLPDPCCKLWLASQGETLIAGQVFFYFNHYAVSWHSASLTSHLSYKPNQVLDYHIMQDAKERGYKIYDFDTSAGLAGVVSHKRGFGAANLESNIFSP